MTDEAEQSIPSRGSTGVAFLLGVEAAYRIIVKQQRREIERLKEAIRRIAEQDATLSTSGMDVIVTMDSDITPREWAAIKYLAEVALPDGSREGDESIDAIRGLVKRER
jgi:preprotein translocase subunit YajC